MHSKKTFLEKQFEENQKVVFAKRLNEVLQEREHKETLDSLAELFDVERTTVNNWKHGKTLPGKAKRRNIAKALNLPENYFEPDFSLIDRDIADARYHWKMDQHSVACGDEIGLDEDFVRFIRNNDRFPEIISNMQVIDLVLNSMDQRVPRTNSAYQFTDKAGERFYINEYMIYVLRVIQGDVEEYIHMLLLKYAQIMAEEDVSMKNKGLDDWIMYYQSGYFARRVKYLENEKARRKTMF